MSLPMVHDVSMSMNAVHKENNPCKGSKKACFSGKSVVESRPEQDGGGSVPSGSFISSRFLFPGTESYQQRYPALALRDKEFLVVRTVPLYLSGAQRPPGIYRTRGELDYLLSGKLTPKPGTLLLNGVPQTLHLDNFDLALLLKKQECDLLAAYKVDVGTRENSDLNQLFAKRFVSIDQFTDKLQEINLRRFPMLPDQGWGHIDGQGGVKTGKISIDPAKYFTNTLAVNEVLMTGYRPEDILGIVLTENMPLLEQKGLTRPVIFYLKAKKVLETALGLPSLPVFFYHQQSGSIIHQLAGESTEHYTRTLEPIADSADWLPCDPASLPAFFEQWSYEDYPGQLEQEADSIQSLQPMSSLENVRSAIERLNEKLEPIRQGRGTPVDYLALADFSSYLTCYTRFEKKGLKRLAGSGSFVDRLPLIKVLGFNAFFNAEVIISDPGACADGSADEPAEESKGSHESSLSPFDLNGVKTWDRFLQVSLRRAEVIDEIINTAGIAEQVSKLGISPVDFLQNPLMAMHWLENHCDFSDDDCAWGCLFNAIVVLDSFPCRLSIDQRKDYFRQLLFPLCQHLSKQLPDSFLQTTMEKYCSLLNQVLNRWLALSKSSFKPGATINGELIINMEVDALSNMSDDVSVMMNEMKWLYNSLAFLVHFCRFDGRPYNQQWRKRLNGFSTLLLGMDEFLLKSEFMPELFRKLNFPVKWKDFQDWVPAPESVKSLYRVPEIIRNAVVSASPSDHACTTKAFASGVGNVGNKGVLLHQGPLDKILQDVISHYYLSPHPAQLRALIKGEFPYQREKLWRSDHGVDHIARTVILQEAVITLHKTFSRKYQRLFAQYPKLEYLLILATAYHDVVAEIAPKAEEERLAAEALERDLHSTGLPEATVRLVISALRNKNSNTMAWVPDGYTADAMVTDDERLVRRLLRQPDSLDIARVKTVIPTISFQPPQLLLSADDHHAGVYSAGWMDLDPELIQNRAFMEQWSALMKTAVYWAGLTGAPPANADTLKPGDLLPYEPNPRLLCWNSVNSEQRKKVIARSSDSIGYTREILSDIVRMYVAQKADRPFGNLFQLRQIELPAQWTVLDSFLHFTAERQVKLQPLIQYWRENTFKHHIGTLTQDLLASPRVREALPGEWGVHKVCRQRGYSPGGELQYEGVWHIDTGSHISKISPILK